MSDPVCGFRPNQKDAFGRPLPLTGTVERRIAANIGINI
jgi:hypothetical protein